MKKYFSAFTFVFCFLITQLFCQIKVISPIPGVWSNKQMLAIDNSDGEEYYYSLNGQDPISFGFAYDNPVLIDLTGDVSIIITKSGKKKETVKIQYTVEQEKAEEKDYFQFIDLFFDTGVLNYTVGSEIYIPSSLIYSLNLPPDSFIQGNSISISENSVLSDIVPCVLKDPQSEYMWRFLIRVYPQNQGVFTRKEVPFEIVDWEKINFIDDDYIFKIDNEYWELPKKSRVLDRTVSHTIQWQSIAYEQGNPVQTFELPPKPQILKNSTQEGSLLFTIQGDSSYQMGIVSESDEYQELYTEIGIDTFFGNSINGKLNIQMFSNSVYQGDIKVDYEINKKPPCAPEIQILSNNSFYSRQSVSGVIFGQNDSELYVSISDPFIIPPDQQIYDSNSEVLLSLPEKEFSLINGNEYRFNLDPLSDGACYYIVKAFSKKDNVISLISIYSVIIDKYNYYYDESYSYDDSDGTKTRPYNNFAQCFSAINKGRNAVLNIKGPMHIPSGKNDILSNCKFVNEENAELIFEENSCFNLKNSTLSFTDFTIICEPKSDYNNSKIFALINVESGTLDIQKCTISANLGKNAYLFDLSNSVLFVNDSVISVSSSDYCSFANAEKSHFQIINSNISVSGKTCVAISICQGDIKLINNNIKVTGKIGRIGELFFVDGVISQNKFTADLPQIKNSTPLFMNESFIEELENEAYGF